MIPIHNRRGMRKRFAQVVHNVLVQQNFSKALLMLPIIYNYHLIKLIYLFELSEYTFYSITHVQNTVVKIHTHCNRITY